MSEQKTILPFFPLNISLLPGEDIPLRIFEPRYIQLINECEKQQSTFGIPYFKDKGPAPFGSEVKIRQIVARNNIGEMVIVIEGISIIKIVDFQDPLPGKLYSGGNIARINCDAVIQNRELFNLIADYTDNLDNNFLKDTLGKGSIKALELAQALNLSSEDKYKFIASCDHKQREDFLLAHLIYLKKLREQEKLLNNDYFLN